MVVHLPGAGAQAFVLCLQRILTRPGALPPEMSSFQQGVFPAARSPCMLFSLWVQEALVQAKEPLGEGLWLRRNGARPAAVLAGI